LSVRGAILDSGNVLIHPTNGQWFPPAAFAAVLTDRALAWDQRRLPGALAAGEAYLNVVHSVPLRDQNEERAVWTQYFGILLRGVGVSGDVRELARAMAEASDVAPGVEPYPWTVDVLAGLRERAIPVVVLSDAWPSLRRIFRQLGLDSYVRGMVISGEEGIAKPDPRVFRKALDLVGHEAAQVAFVDDHPGHVHAAVRLEMCGVRLRHPGEESDPTLKEVTDLRDLLDLLE
jgi:putative hydrolase of the HAD superfamily